ncbi:MAG: universal stress protein [Desulfobulbaceae bacterium]|nr:universal stress protein [Desulfobulbaceae bacterium]
MKVDKILVPVDFSENSNKIARYGAFVAKQFGAEIHLLFVAQIFQDYSEFFVPHMPVIQFEEDLVASAENRMVSFVEENLEKDFTGSVKVLAGDAAETILEYAQEQEIDMIVMGTHGYKGLEKVLFGSVAEKVVKMSSCPVLTVNPYK